jgi:hypothetical protein
MYGTVATTSSVAMPNMYAMTTAQQPQLNAQQLALAQQGQQLQIQQQQQQQQALALQQQQLQLQQQLQTQQQTTATTTTTSTTGVSSTDATAATTATATPATPSTAATSTTATTAFVPVVAAAQSSPSTTPVFSITDAQQQLQQQQLQLLQQQQQLLQQQAAQQQQQQQQQQQPLYAMPPMNAYATAMQSSFTSPPMVPVSVHSFVLCSCCCPTVAFVSEWRIDRRCSHYWLSSKRMRFVIEIFLLFVQFYSSSISLLVKPLVSLCFICLVPFDLWPTRLLLLPVVLLARKTKNYHYFLYKQRCPTLFNYTLSVCRLCATQSRTTTTQRIDSRPPSCLRHSLSTLPAPP